MSFPVRCYTCNAPLAQKHPRYRDALREGTRASEALQALDVTRSCCRRMFLGHVDLVADQVRHPNVDRALDEGGTVLQRLARAPRTVSCD